MSLGFEVKYLPHGYMGPIRILHVYLSRTRKHFQIWIERYPDRRR